MIFVDAAAIVAILGNEPEAKRCAAGILAYSRPFTSPVAVWEATVALARTDHLGLPPKEGAKMVERFLQEYGIELRQLPPPAETVELSTDAAHRYRSGRQRLNLADCFHYACAKHGGVPILSTADEFRFTDLEVHP